MTWVTEIEAVYSSATEARDAFEVIGALDGVTAERRGKTITVEVAYGDRSKYGAVRPAVDALNAVFDPVAIDDYYRSWPVRLVVTSRWRT